MTFTSSQKAYIKSEFEKRYTDGGKYALVYKENNEYKTTWSITSTPTWNWNVYEYRLLKYLDRPLVKSEIEDIFVYVYKGIIYYNDPNNELHSYYVAGKDASDALTTVMAVDGDFTVFGENTNFGDDQTYDAVLRIVGATKYNGDPFNSDVYMTGPKIRISSNEDSSNGWTAITYSDKQANSDGIVETKKPYLKIESYSHKDYFIIPRKKTSNLTVKTKTAKSVVSKNANISNLNTTIKFTDIQQICKNFFPIGCFYWTSDSTFNPENHFGGKWESVKNTFMYAASFTTPNVTTAQFGEEKHTISYNELAAHSHNINEPAHSHSISVGSHSHSIRDPGHTHSIRTVGDDYNGSNCKDQRNTGNFVGDGQYDMTDENIRRGLYAINSRTGIWLGSAKTNVSINNSSSGFQISSFIGGGQPHNNMPPYIAAFCWHRIA